jgi:hypothetical protein
MPVKERLWGNAAKVFVSFALRYAVYCVEIYSDGGWAALDRSWQVLATGRITSNGENGKEG